MRKPFFPKSAEEFFCLRPVPSRQVWFLPSLWGVHSFTHDYRQIYASPDAFFQDFEKMHGLIQQAAGADTRICRFPGGSVNGYSRRTRKAILAGLKKRGYVYYDWNVGSGDATSKTKPREIVGNALKGVAGHKTSVVLFHNSATKKGYARAASRISFGFEETGLYVCHAESFRWQQPVHFLFHRTGRLNGMENGVSGRRGACGKSCPQETFASFLWAAW